MHYRNKYAIAMLICFAALNARAQSCPPSVDVVATVPGALPAWDAAPARSVHVLSGMDVVDGKLDRENAGNNATLRPVDEPNGDYAWKFRAPVGTAEVWMRCSYRATSVRLDRRVDALARECRGSKITAKKGSGKSLVLAACK